MLFGSNTFLFMGVTVGGVTQNSLMSLGGQEENVSNEENCPGLPVTLQMKGPFFKESERHVLYNKCWRKYPASRIFRYPSCSQ